MIRSIIIDYLKSLEPKVAAVLAWVAIGFAGAAACVTVESSPIARDAACVCSCKCVTQLAMPSGIYAIIHRDSGRWYVGQSQDIMRRWRHHRKLLRKGTHDNFNLARDAQANMRGRNHTAESRSKMSESCRGRILSPETCAKISAALKGRPAPNKGKSPSDETRAKMSAVGLGRTQSPEWVARRIAATSATKLARKRN